MSRYKEGKVHILLFILGCVVFSPLSTILSQQYLHLPLALPELFALPIILLLRPRFKRIPFKTAFFESLVIVFLFTVLALLFGYFSFYAVLSNARVWFYLFFTYKLFKKYPVLSLNELYWLAFGCILGWFISSVHEIGQLVTSSITGDKSITTTGMMLSIPIFIPLLLKGGKNKIHIFIGVLLILGILVFSGIRRAIFVALISVFLTIFLSVINNPAKIFKYSIFIISFIIVFSIFLPQISDMVREISPMLYVRVFERTELLLSEGIGASDDTIRMNMIHQFFNSFIEYTIPRGFVSLQTDVNAFTGIFNDLPLLLLCWVFSWPVTLFFIFHVFNKLRNCYRIYCQTTDNEGMVFTITLLTMLSLLFIEGTFLTFAFATPFTGALLGWASRYSKRKFIV